MRPILSTSPRMLIAASAQAETIHPYAAGSLRAAVTEIARAFGADSGGQHKVNTTFRASGSPKAREGRSPCAWGMTSDQADIFLTYCASALQAKAETPAPSIVSIGKTLNVAAEYGLIAPRNLPATAEDLATYSVARAQAILLPHGFSPANAVR